MDLEKKLKPSVIPVFPGDLKKNDALFLYGAIEGEKNFVFSYEQETSEVVHGPSCKIQNEIDVDKCAIDGVPVIERRGGGGTVVLSKGMCIIIIVGFRRDRTALPIFREIHAAMISILKSEGIDKLEQQGISDITLDNKKILGSSLYLGTKPPLYYYQSCLMVSSEIGLLGRYLKHPPREPEYRKSRSHDSFCTTLLRAGHVLSPSAICSLFNSRLPEMIS